MKYVLCPTFPHLICGRLWTKIFCPQKTAYYRKLKCLKGMKKCSQSNDREHFVLNREEITSSETPQQQQPRKRSYRPWGCCLRPGSPSSQRKIRLSAAFRLRRRDFWSGKPVFSQNKKHIARKRYVVLSFSGLSYHITCSRNKTFELS